MLAVEFEAKVVDGKIEIPEAVRERVSGEVSVILFSQGADRQHSVWPEQNRRRWELIAEKTRRELTREEADELATLQNRADDQLAEVGSRPVDRLERLYAELTEQD